MVSKKEVAAAFKAAADALGVRGEELGALLSSLSKLSEEELEFFPIGDNKAIIEFARSSRGEGASTSAPDAKHLRGQHGLAPQAATPAKISRKVVRLMRGTEPVGSGCLLEKRRTGEWLLATARHCLDPQPGQPIGDLGLTAYGHRLKHVASFPHHDISVLAFEGSPHEDARLQEQESINPFVLAGGMGLARGWQVTAAGFPLAVDEDVPGAESCDEGVVSSGVISWLDPKMDLALGDYGGAMPNFSGGAVTFLGEAPGLLVGLHLGTVFHREGELTAGDDVRPQGDRPAEGVWGGVASRDLMETGSWAEAPRMTLLSSGPNRCRASADQGASKSGLLVEEAIRFCLANVEHRGFLSCFVPAHTLNRPLEVALGRLEGGTRTE